MDESGGELDTSSTATPPAKTPMATSVTPRPSVLQQLATQVTVNGC